MRSLLVALLLFASLVAPVAQERPLPDFNAFAAEVKKHLATDQERQSGYVFNERRVEQKLDAAGRVTSETVKVYEVYPGLPGENRYRRPVEDNGRATPADRLAKLDDQRRKKAEEYARNQTMPSERQKESRQQDKARQEYSASVEDIFRVFDIQMLRREAIDGHDTILARLTPKKNAAPQTDDGKIMKHFTALAWVSESDYELVRVEIEAVDTLSFGLGLLARVHKGTVASYQRRKVNNETWLPAEVSWTASARVLLLRRLRVRGVSQYSNYRRYTVETSTTIAPPR